VALPGRDVTYPEVKTFVDPPQSFGQLAEKRIVESGPSNRLLDLPIGRSRATGIDLMRGALAMAVVFTHLVAWGGVTGSSSSWAVGLNLDIVKVFQPAGETYPAVLAFIVLSGYCIHRNGLRRNSNGFAVSAYGIRRFFRIVPVYVLGIVAGVVAFAYLHRVDPDVGKSLVTTSGISSNCVVPKLTGTGVFNPADHACTTQGNFPLQTVIVEIWLYIVYAAVAVLLLRRFLSDRMLAIGVLLAWIGGMVWVNSHPGDATWWHNGSLLGFLAFWWIGAKFTDPVFARRVLRLLPVVLAGWLALTIVLMHTGNYADANPASTASIFLVEARKMLFALVVGVVIVAVDGLAVRQIELPGRLGQAGYSIYAFHAPLVLALLIAGVAWYIVGISAFVFGLVAFWLVERPLNRLGKKLARRHTERALQGGAADRRASDRGPAPQPSTAGATSWRGAPLGTPIPAAGVAQTSTPAVRGTSQHTS
jgi:peptidoglycan/LPS O-acetylase OafA/YrhL